MEEQSYARFRQTLRRADHHALDELFNFAHFHTAEVSYAAYAFPMEYYLLSMVLEEHKQVQALRDQVTALRAVVEQRRQTREG